MVDELYARVVIVGGVEGARDATQQQRRKGMHFCIEIWWDGRDFRGNIASTATYSTLRVVPTTASFSGHS